MRMKILVIALTALAVSACGYSETSEEQVGALDGCTYSWLRVKGHFEPVFVAKCGCTVTAAYRQGKKNVSSVTVSEPQ